MREIFFCARNASGDYAVAVGANMAARPIKHRQTRIEMRKRAVSGAEKERKSRNDAVNALQEAKMKKTCSAWTLQVFCFLVGRAGFEPATNGLKVRCSTS